MNEKYTLSLLSSLLAVFAVSSFSLAESPSLSQGKSTALPQASYANENSPLGTNLAPVAYWSTEMPFLDHFKTASGWISQCGYKGEGGCSGEWSTGEESKLDLDENGWVRSLPGDGAPEEYTRVTALLFAGMAGIIPAGRYYFLYDGEGTLRYSLDAKKSEEESLPGRDVVHVAPSKEGLMQLTIVSTDPRKTGNYIRNIRAVRVEDMPLYEKGEIFNPVFLKKIEKFHALRFMDWMNTNNSLGKEWKDRPVPPNKSYADKGVPLEIMIALANKLHADPWFNMPHMASDDYLKNFAHMVKGQLDPGLKAYVEYSNEVWNGQFQQYNYALEQGKAQWGEKSDVQRQWYGMRAAQTCDIWKNEFGGDSGRVACVISTQTSQHGQESQALDCPYWVTEGQKPCYQHGIDAYAITGYFGDWLGKPEHADTVQSWALQGEEGFKTAFEELKTGEVLKDPEGSIAKTKENFIYHAKVAAKKELQLVVYEGGPGTLGLGKTVNDPLLEDFFPKLHRRAEMYSLYSDLLKGWQKAGGASFFHFNDIGPSSKWGSWGALEFVGQETSPKYKALMDFIDNNPCWWKACGAR